jgi:nickel transport protein
MKKVNEVKRISSLLVLALVLLSVSPSLAHKVKVFAYGEGEKIITKSYFSNGKAVMHSLITVEDGNTGKIFLQGESDKDGLFEFSIPPTAQQERRNLKIILKTGEGHRAEWLLPADEYLEDKGGNLQRETAVSLSGAAVHTAKNEEQVSLSPVIRQFSCDEEVVTRIVDDALDRKLAPLKEMLQQSRDSGPDFRDILGGIGWIVGLAGIAAYISSRKKNSQ